MLVCHILIVFSIMIFYAVVIPSYFILLMWTCCLFQDWQWLWLLKKYLGIYLCIGATINYFELNWIGFAMCPQEDVSVICCGSHQVQGHGFWPSKSNAWDFSTWRVCCWLQCCQKWSQFGPSHSVSWWFGILHCCGQRKSYLRMMWHAR